jgi:DNA-binding transcriptional regulator YiaG
MSPKYPKKVETLGDHIRKRRLDMGLLQKDVASRISVDAETVYRWESNESLPSVTHLPRIIRFLGYDPLPAPRTFTEQVRDIRKHLGLSQVGMARLLGIDPTTLRKWEQGRARPNRHSLRIIKKFICR